MTEDIKKLIANMQKSAIGNRHYRENTNKQTLYDILRKCERNRRIFNEMLFRALAIGCIIKNTKKCYETEDYNLSVHDGQYANSFRFTPYAIVINDIDDIYYAKNNNPYDYRADEIYKMKIYIASHTARTEINVITQFNRDNLSSGSQIIFLQLKNEDDINRNPVIIPCLIDLNELKKFGFTINTNYNKSLSFDIYEGKLEEKINEILSAKQFNNSYFSIDDLKEIISVYEDFKNTKGIVNKYLEDCKTNLEIIALDIYKNIINDYKNNFLNITNHYTFTQTLEYYKPGTIIRKVCRESDLIIYNKFEAAHKIEEENAKKVYGYSSTLPRVIFAKHTSNSYIEYLPILSSDLDNLIKELGATTNGLQLQEKDNDINKLIINVDSLTFEDLLINSHDEKTK